MCPEGGGGRRPALCACVRVCVKLLFFFFTSTHPKFSTAAFWFSCKTTRVLKALVHAEEKKISPPR